MLAVAGLPGNQLETDVPLTSHRESSSAQNEHPAPNYKNQQARLETFHNKWPENSPVNCTDLANDGFIYTGRDDRVQCYFCNVVLLGWEPGDIVSDEHLKHKPDCPFKTGQSSQDVANISSESYRSDSGYHSLGLNSTPMSTSPTEYSGEDVPPQIQNITEYPENLTSVNVISNENTASCSRQNDEPSASLGIAPRLTPKHSRYMLEMERLKTFATWPEEKCQKPEDLAKAGFFFLGSCDKTKCFCCNGNLMNWEPDDDPFVEHARWFPDCGYIKLLKGEKFVQDVSSKNRTHLSTLPPKVVAVMEQGYTREQIENTLHRNNKSFDDFNNAENLLIFLLESDVDTTFHPEGMTEDQTSHMLVAEEPAGIRNDTPSINSMEVLSNDEMKSFENIKSENHKMREQLTCKICMEEDACVVFLPCGHLVTCGSCAAAMNKCPLCRKPIKGTVRTYLG